MTDEKWMSRALALAKKGEYTARPNPLVGCVLVKDDQVVGEGLHWQAGGAHAEVAALAQAGERARGATAYVTLEPCVHVGRTGPCVEALIAAGLQRIVVATRDPDPRVGGKGIARLLAAGIVVKEAVLEEAARALNKGFLSRMERKRPYVRGKIAMSIDGRTAMKSGESQWITGQQARDDVHRWRARSGVILTTGKTVQHDDCRLTVRGISMDLPVGITFVPPVRMILDNGERVLPSARIFQEPGEVRILLGGEQAIGAHLTQMAEESINDVWIEAGPTLLGSMMQRGWIDEWVVYVAPKWLGQEGQPMAYLSGVEQLRDHVAGKFSEVVSLGDDLRITVTL